MSKKYNVALDTPIVSGDTQSPDSKHVSIYAKSDGNIYGKKNNNTENLLVSVQSQTPAVGDTLIYNGTGYTTQPQFITHYSDTGITSNKKLNTNIPAGYKIFSIIASETNGGDVSGVRLYTTGKTNDVAGPNDVMTNSNDNEFGVSKGFYSTTSNTDIYVSGTFGTGALNLYFTFIRITAG